MLTIADVAKQVAVTGRPMLPDAQTQAKRLLAKGRITHYPQADGSALVSPAHMEEYFRRGGVDRSPPTVRAGWFDDDDLERSASGFENALRVHAEAMLPKAHPGKAEIEVVSVPAAIAALMREPAGVKMNGVRLATLFDAALVQRLRVAARTVICGDGRAANLNPIASLYASHAKYTAIVKDAVFEVCCVKPLVKVSKKYSVAGYQGVQQYVSVEIPLLAATKTAHVQRLADLAF